MLFTQILSNGDVIGSFVNKVGTTNDVVRIAKVQGIIIAYVSNTATANFVVIPRETLLGYIALTGTAPNRVVLNGIVSQAEITANVGDITAVQALSLSTAYNSTSNTRNALSTEIVVSGLLEGDLDSTLTNNVNYQILLLSFLASKKILDKYGKYPEVVALLKSVNVS